MAWVADAKFAGNMSAWASRAGLSRSMLSTFGSRWAAHRAGDGEAPSLKADTLAKLAEVAGVSFEWLSTGRGEPGELGAPSNPCALADLYRTEGEIRPSRDPAFVSDFAARVARVTERAVTELAARLAASPN